MYTATEKDFIKYFMKDLNTYMKKLYISYVTLFKPLTVSILCFGKIQTKVRLYSKKT